MYTYIYKPYKPYKYRVHKINKLSHKREQILKRGKTVFGTHDINNV